MVRIEKYIDHTLLKPTATEADIAVLCSEAVDHQLFAVCVNSSFIPFAAQCLLGSEVKLAAVAGFPLGAMASKLKLTEALYCLENGADEIDVVMNIGRFKGMEYKAVENELKEIKTAMGSMTLKVIIETCYLTDEEKVKATQLVMAAGADFVKTSTGFGSGGATFDDVALMKKTVGEQIRIKASGGIKNREDALKYLELGASRLGTSSGLKLI